MIDGILLVDKPDGTTSADVVRAVKRRAPADERRPPGHARSDGDRVAAALHRRRAPRSRSSSAPSARPTAARSDSASRPTRSTSTGTWSLERAACRAIDAAAARRGRGALAGARRAAAADVLGGQDAGPDALRARPRRRRRSSVRRGRSRSCTSTLEPSRDDPAGRASRSAARRGPTCASSPRTSLASSARWPPCERCVGPGSATSSVAEATLWPSCIARGAGLAAPIAPRDALRSARGSRSTPGTAFAIASGPARRPRRHRTARARRSGWRALLAPERRLLAVLEAERRRVDAPPGRHARGEPALQAVSGMLRAIQAKNGGRTVALAAARKAGVGRELPVPRDGHGLLGGADRAPE